MEWLQTPPAQPKVACGVRVCWDMEDKDPYPDPCGLQVCIIKFCLHRLTRAHSPLPCAMDK